MSWFKQKRIFLDYASATPVLPEVEQIMKKYWSSNFHNPSSIYEEGLWIKREIEECRARIGRSLGVQSKDIIFTSSGTESDNLAILGTFEKSLEIIKKPHIIISAIEHPAVVAAAEEVVRRGGEMSILPVNAEGIVSLDALKKFLKKNTFLVSIGYANNEVGTIQPILKIGRILREYRKQEESLYPYFHTDASQAPSFLNIDLDSLQTDLMTLDGSKIYGPKGVGVLALRRGVKLHYMRSGTPNPALISGFTLALEITLKDREKESKRLEVFRKYFIDQVTKRLPQVVVNGSLTNHLPNILSLSIPNTLSEFIVLKLDRAGVMASVGSACSNDEMESGSPVIEALGKGDLSESTLRFSFGRFSTPDEVKRAIEIFCRTVDSVIKWFDGAHHK